MRGLLFKGALIRAPLGALLSWFLYKFADNGFL